MIGIFLAHGQHHPRAVHGNRTVLPAHAGWVQVEGVIYVRAQPVGARDDDECDCDNTNITREWTCPRLR